MTLIALHMLQNHAPSNLNRDDNGDPKDCVFGGYRRARISSQALKRSIRWSDTFRTYYQATPEVLADRTQLLPEMVRERLRDYDLADEAKSSIIHATARLGKGEASTAAAEAEGTKKTRRGKRGDGDNEAEQRIKTAQLMFLANHEIDQLTEQLVTIVREKGIAHLDGLSGDPLVKAIGSYEPHAADIAMFGRMTTSSPFKDVEAAVQVAHAISTHSVEQEFDFYTAVDDRSGEAGAGFIGEVAFNSATYYKYFSIDWDALVKNLHGDLAMATTTVRALLHAAIFAIPSGKQNSFAAHNVPELVLVEVRPQHIALSYANAFVKPVRATADLSLVEASVTALANYIPKINTMYNLEAERAILSSVPITLEGAQHCTSINDLLAWLPIPTNHV
ncbi:MAG: type I-E CRISPR-associated protein Cas7/Cse4/CasC [Roseiflexaceae bacterium]